METERDPGGRDGLERIGRVRAWVWPLVLALWLGALPVGCAENKRNPGTEGGAPPGGGSADLPGPGGGERVCQPRVVGSLQDPEQDEVSGMDASLTQPGVYWIHNDSGEETARIFAIDEKGTRLGTYAVDLATNVDWEDLSVGPCTDGQGSCIFLADSGNNGGDRVVFDLYEIREPQPYAPLRLEAQKIQFRYDQGQAWNAEAFAVDPSTGDLYIIRKTKDAEKTLFRFPRSRGSGPSTLVVICSFSQLGHEQITAADIHESGKRLLVRTYEHVYEFAAASMDDPAICGNRVRELVHAEPQGEAIAYADGSDDFLTVSEQPNQPIYRFNCGK